MSQEEIAKQKKVSTCGVWGQVWHWKEILSAQGRLANRTMCRSWGMRQDMTTRTVAKQNPTLISPLYSSPTKIADSKAALLAVFDDSDADVLDLLLQNPALLQCGTSLRLQRPDSPAAAAVRLTCGNSGLVSYGNRALLQRRLTCDCRIHGSRIPGMNDCARTRRDRCSRR